MKFNATVNRDAVRNY